MTQEERIIVSAFTGYILCDFHYVHEYIEKKLGRPVWTHEFAFAETWKEIREKCLDDYKSLSNFDEIVGGGE